MVLPERLILTYLFDLLRSTPPRLDEVLEVPPRLLMFILTL